MGTARGWIAALLAVVVLVVGVAVAEAADSATPEPRLTLEFNEVKLYDALTILFQGTPYSFALEPGLSGSMTLTLNDVPWTTALWAVLIANSPKLTYRREGDVYIIVKMPEGARPPGLVELAEPEHRLLYVTRLGDRAQMRLRTYPNPGREDILWEGLGIRYLLPSPAARWVAIVPETAPPLVMEVDSRKAQTIGEGLRVLSARWKDDRVLSLLATEAPEGSLAEWEYAPETAKLTRGQERGADLEVECASFLEPSYEDKIARLKETLAKGLLASMAGAGEMEAAAAVVQGAGIPWRPAAGQQAVLWEAAFSPDGNYLAITSGQSALCLITLGSGHVSQLVGPEGTALTGPRWSYDSGSLLYLQRQLPFALDQGEQPETQDRPPLVRMYTLVESKTETVAIGEMAFLLPPGPERTAPAAAGEPHGD